MHLDSTARDLTHLMAESEQHRRLLDHIPAEIGIFDTAGRFLFNSSAGIRDPAVRQWVLGRTHHDYCRARNYPLAIADRRQRAIEQVVAEHRSVSIEELWVGRSGRHRHYIRTFCPVFDGDGGSVTRVIAHGQEITELKQAEEDLRRTRGELREAVELRERVEAELRRARAQVEALGHRLDYEVADGPPADGTGPAVAGILGTSPAIACLRRAIETVAPTDVPVLVQGETGTGKELVARALHAASLRGDRPLVKVNCASVPDGLFESEFFGHVRGAFTGAVRDRAGRFELAAAGTLFLDEIGEIPLPMQSKLLRVLQEGEFERVGGNRTCAVDVRIIAVTNRDLRREVEVGRFRSDLYYRLTVYPLEVAALRDRPEDVPLLLRHFLERSARRLRRPVAMPDPAQLRRLQEYEWPGNVRELQNLVERALISARGGRVRLEPPGVSCLPGASSESPWNGRVLREPELRRQERENLLAALEQTGWRIHGLAGAARLLGIKPTTLASRMKRLGLRRPGNDDS